MATCFVLCMGILNEFQAHLDPGEVVRHLRQAEQLVQSAYCEYREICLPTRPEMVQALREYLTVTGQPKKLRELVITEDYAKKKSVSVRWWRKGEMERLEVVPLHNPGRPPQVTAFDGQILRRISADQQSADLFSAAGASWLADGSRIHPFAILFKYQNSENYSNLLERAPMVLVDPAQDSTGTVRESLFFQHPVHARVRFRLFLDDEFRLKERHYYLGEDRTITGNGEIHSFSDYRKIDLNNGKAIWFPRKVVYSHILDRDQSGRLLEWKRTVLQIDKMEPNPDIPDDKFVAKIPLAARVWDGLVNHRYLEPGVRPAAVFNYRPPRWWEAAWVRYAVAGCLGLIVLALTWRLFRGKKVLVRSS